MDILEMFILFLIIYVLISLILFIVNFIKKKRNSIETDRLIIALIKRYELNKNYNTKVKISNMMVFINSFIISLPLTIFIGIKVKYYVVVLVSMIIIIPMMFILYNLLGIILKKKGW